MIADAIAAMEAAFNTADSSLWTGQDGDRSGPCKFGVGTDQEARALRSAPPRIFFSLQGATVTTSGVPRGGEPGAIARRDVSAVAHIWGGTQSQAERIYTTWAAASHGVLSAWSFAIDSETWSIGEDVQVKNGEMVHVAFRMSIPLTRLPSKFARANQASLKKNITQPGG